MDQDHLHLIISMLCISQLILLQAVLRLKARIHRLEEENGQKKGQN